MGSGHWVLRTMVVGIIHAKARLGNLIMIASAALSNSLSKVTTRKPAELKMSPILVLTVNTFGTTETTAISFGFWPNQNII
ncbi:hypothetical protein B0H12DRAFT_1162472 [Mycena haematopus]|nr:hypothetical protein B0H12DRAFT_1162472 [Mycena haematopus]